MLLTITDNDGTVLVREIYTPPATPLHAHHPQEWIERLLEERGYIKCTVTGQWFPKPAEQGETDAD